MTDAIENLPAATNTEASVELSQAATFRVPQYRRNIVPTNLVLSAADLKEFCQIVEKANERAQVIEYNNLNLAEFESPEAAKDRVQEFVRLEYNYGDSTGDSVQGLGIPNTDDHEFPDDLKTFYVSNSSYAQRAINVRPLNTVDAFLAFERPTLKIDLQTLPSNPTMNRSIINVSGRDEDWVISTADRLRSFLDKRKSFRPVIHGSGSYDYLVYLVFLPTVLWILHEDGTFLSEWLKRQSTFMNVVLGIYALLLSLLFARFLFQYLRWLFPPMEYYKRSRWSAYLHRALAGVIFSTLILNAIYDIVKVTVTSLLGG
ncbi:hypothetical protein [Rhizobium giardinii]|uniref:hypothetical protein n=1 Tax=Rhizobium giardinii TaxID=56731 RepID=UPI0013AEA124